MSENACYQQKCQRHSKIGQSLFRWTFYMGERKHRDSEIVNENWSYDFFRHYVYIELTRLIPIVLKLNKSSSIRSKMHSSDFQNEMMYIVQNWFILLLKERYTYIFIIRALIGFIISNDSFNRYMKIPSSKLSNKFEKI